MSIVNIKSNDLEVLWTQPSSNIDRRAPTAQELAASSRLTQKNIGGAIAPIHPSGLLTRPTFNVAASLGLTIPAGLSFYTPMHPSLNTIASATTINLPALADAVSTISRYDYVYLVCLGVEVGATIDPDINLTFEWQGAGALQTLTKENSRRIRSHWAIAVAESQITASGLYAALASGMLTSSTLATGIDLGAIQLYTLDPAWVDATEYKVVEGSIDLIDLCRVWRSQNLTQTGYIWGNGGENDFELDYHVQPTGRYVGGGWDNLRDRQNETLNRIMLGYPLPFSPSYDRSVQNLLNGQVGLNADAPGVAAASPNGSVAIANNQRVSFSCQALLQKTYCLPVITADAGGLAQASVPFQTSPTGAKFSENLTDHRVFSVTGEEITAKGTLTGLGSTGALVWTAANSSVAAVGDLVYFQPSISYPSGSGLPVAGTVEAVYLNGAPLNAANVREAAVGDLSAYAAPAGGGSYFVVLGRERAALHYVLKRVTATTTAGGVLAMPQTERGAIAFVEGVSGRIDSPIVAGLTPNTSYNFLVYYPPRSDESWQIQIKTARYKGTAEKTWLNGSTVTTPPMAIAHTQGGGNREFLSESDLQYVAIALHMPKNTLSDSIKPHQLNFRVVFADESNAAASSIRQIFELGAAGYALPKVGQSLLVEDAASAQTQGMAIRLKNAKTSQPLGVLKRPLVCSARYQLAIAWIASKDNQQRLVVATVNGGDPGALSGVALDSDGPHYSAIDTFRLF